MSRKRTAPPPAPLPGAVDAHAHTWDRQIEGDHAAVMARAWGAGLAAIVEVGTDVTTSEQARALAAADARVHAVAGLHPHEASRLDQERDALAALVAGGDFVAVGEIGLDFYRDLSPRDAQAAAFEWQLELAREHGLPVVIHSRDADEACFAMIEAWGRRTGRYLGADREVGMMHCYAGDAELAARYVELGFLISVPGTVTYPANARGQEVACTLPLERLLTETDSPYLTPVPWRGGRNEPAYVVETVRFVARLRGEAPEHVARVTARNAARLFGFEIPVDRGETGAATRG
ncbi:MAG: TatD family hydrolase [Dehalococcoidia bacterium]